MTEAESKGDHERLERLRVLFLLGETVEKLVRLRQILKRQRIFVGVGDKKAEYASVIDPLLKAVEEQSERLALNSSRINSFLGNAALDEAQRTALAAIIQKVINVAQQLHEILILLPRETVEPQIFLLLRDCFGEAWRETPVIMTNELTSYEYRIDDVLDQLDIGQHSLEEWRRLLKGFTRGGSVLAQAFVDRDNPLAWAVLAHEFGHALDGKRISREIVYGDQAVEPRAAEKDPKVKWAAEIFADFVAARVLGPASQMPILLLEMSRPTLVRASDEAPSHPPTTVRLALVREYLKGLGVGTGRFDEVFELYNFDYARKLSALDEAERSRRKEIEAVVEGFLRSHVVAVAAKVNSLSVRTFGDREFGHARKLERQLQSDLPISSFRHASDDQILPELNSLVGSGSVPERVYEVLSGFDETPSTSSEILTAGWLYKLASFEERLKDSFHGEDGSAH